MLVGRAKTTHELAGLRAPISFVTALVYFDLPSLLLVNSRAGIEDAPEIAVTVKVFVEDVVIAEPIARFGNIEVFERVLFGTVSRGFPDVTDAKSKATTVIRSHGPRA